MRHPSLRISALLVVTAGAASSVEAAAPAGVSPPNSVWVESAPQTFLFGVEQRWPRPGAPGQYLIEIDDQHVDLRVRLFGGGSAWQFAAGIGAGDFDHATMLSITEAYLYANGSSKLTMPDLPGFEFIGAAPGNDVWILPQGQFPGLLYLGYASDSGSADGLLPWNPGDPRGATVETEWFRVSLTAVRGMGGSPAPGHVAVWQSDSSGSPTIQMATSDGIGVDDSLHLLGPGHSHYNWGFTAPGLYEIDLQFGTFVSVPEPAGGLATATATAALSLVRRPRRRSSAA